MEFSRRVNQLQGPRPAALTLNALQSVKIKKPAPPQKAAVSKPPSRCPFDPVIVYLRSPTIIHVKPEEFMDLVQRLTGNRPCPALLPGSSAGNSTVNNASSSSASSCAEDELCLNGAGLALAMPSGLISPDFDGYNGFCPRILDDFDN
ncbi:hypothetical protein MLD38_020175 [Melastoma candidum]|uniref:Uncharacterized protein n=1 Tax=Melastoma candidum TaxID=119954 RepID=A0ACB9QC92_9MYRT|nr:hypothetical protein MLD38_020175 [Melastoma candidum]